MPRHTLTHFSNPEILQTLAPETLCSLLAPFAEELKQQGIQIPTVETFCKDEAHELAILLTTVPQGVPEELLRMVYRIDAMATPAGMDELLRMMPELNPSWNQWTPIDVAIQAWQHDPHQFELIFANRQIGRRSRKFTSYDSLSDWQNCDVSPENVAQLEFEVSQEFQSRGRGEGVRLFLSHRDDEIWMLLRHGEPLRRESCLRDGQSASVLFRPERYDAIVLVRSTKELRINATSRWQKELYRRLCGTHLFGNPDFFPDGDRYTLKPLLEEGSRSLMTVDLPGIEAIKLIELEYFDRAPGLLGTKKWADDLFQMLGPELYSLPAEARLAKAKFLMKFRGASTWRTVTIAPPNDVKYALENDAANVEEWLEKRGFLLKRGEGSDETTDEVDPILEIPGVPA